jgi:hypothetical protein
VASLREGKLRLVVYENDHPPPHVHVLEPSWEIRIELTTPPALMTVMGPAKRSGISSALLAVYRNLVPLKQLWSQVHDQR